MEREAGEGGWGFKLETRGPVWPISWARGPNIGHCRTKVASAACRAVQLAAEEGGGTSSQPLVPAPLTSSAASWTVHPVNGAEGGL